jgi:hypothetical protein
MEEFISFNDGSGKRMTAFVTDSVGISGTTKVFIVKHPDKRFEARMGFSVMGTTNMNEDDFKACDYNPFHSKFWDNYAIGWGDTEEEAIEVLKKEIREMANDLFAE